jgi:hypothetical protein
MCSSCYNKWLYANKPGYKDHVLARKRAYDKQNRPTVLAKKRADSRRRRYGVTPEQVEAMLAAQGRACAICRTPINETVAVDHCHTTKVVRGLLCHFCNCGLGYFKDSRDNLLAAAEYLRIKAAV